MIKRQARLRKTKIGVGTLNVCISHTYKKWEKGKRKGKKEKRNIGKNKEQNATCTKKTKILNMC
jgi:hypothetical protein